METQEVGQIKLGPWILKFDGSRTTKASGVGLILKSPTGEEYSYIFQLNFAYSNNQVEYEALILGLEIFLELGVAVMEIIGDSKLVIK